MGVKRGGGLAVTLFVLALSACGRATGATASASGGVSQDLTFSGALNEHWVAAKVVQCEVEQPQGAGVPDGAVAYEVFMRASVDGHLMMLSLGVPQYHGPGTYRSEGPPAVPTAPGTPLTGYTGPRTPGPPPSPAVIETVPAPGPVTRALVTLFQDGTRRANARQDVPTASLPEITVAPDQAHGTVEAEVGALGYTYIPLFNSPPPARDITRVSGSWSCGSFPVVPPAHSPTVSPSI